jgi:hypothetical protein
MGEGRWEVFQFIEMNLSHSIMRLIMKSQTVMRLLALNKQFYQTFGHEFSSTRLHLQPGVQRVLDGLAGGEWILDLGCGN